MAFRELSAEEIAQVSGGTVPTAIPIVPPVVANHPVARAFRVGWNIGEAINYGVAHFTGQSIGSHLYDAFHGT